MIVHTTGMNHLKMAKHVYEEGTNQLKMFNLKLEIKEM